MGIEIPQRFSDILNSCEGPYRNLVDIVKKNAEEILGDTHPIFFPEYTSHGITHINKTLKIADCLIDSKTITELNSCAMAVLVLSIITHDFGMFITKAALQKTLFSEEKDNELYEKWIKYLNEVKQYNNEKKKRVFGFDDKITSIPSEHERWDERHKKIIGDFLRKHHHELSRKIVTSKFPGATKDIDIFTNTSYALSALSPDNSDDDVEKVRFIIGLLAYSHGVAVRETANDLTKSKLFTDTELHAGIVLTKVPVYFLMVVLRLADLLDAGKHRASAFRESLIGISSPTSQSEWEWNQRVKINEESFNHNKKLLCITANPQNGVEFIKIKEWVLSVKTELDLSWAIITQYYNTNTYLLSVHLIDSDVLNTTTIAGFNKKFITEQARFTVQSTILKQLIDPLYGNDPTYGVRELIQNALDACIEREYVDKKYKREHEEITIAVDTSNKSLIITDNGIGMNQDVIINRFLSVGSSYKESDDFNNNFVKNGKIQVPRSGRFGVGALALFLIGDNATVTTRCYDEDMGYTFVLDRNNLEARHIEISRRDCEIGTTIKINLDDSKVKYFKKSDNREQYNWKNWYYSDIPKVVYKVDGIEKSNIINVLSVSDKNGEKVSWYSIKQRTDFKNYQWSYYKVHKSRSKLELFCNGIIIPDTEGFDDLCKSYGLKIDPPAIFLNDPDAKLQLSLNRYSCFEVPDGKLLLNDLYQYIIAKLLSTDFSSQSKIGSNIHGGFDYIDEKKYGYKKKALPRAKAAYVIKDRSFSLLSEPFLVYTKPSRIAFFITETPNIKLIDISYPNTNCYSYIVYGTGINLHDYLQKFNDRLPFSCDLTHLMSKDVSETHYSKNLKLLNSYIDKSIYDTFTEGLLYKKALTSFEKAIENSELYCNTYYANFNSNYIQAENFELPDSINAVLDYSIAVKGNESDNLMLQQIRDYLLIDSKDIWIPFDMNERIKKFPTVFIELSEKFPEIFSNLQDEYIKVIEELKNKK